MIESLVTFLQTHLIPLGAVGVFLASFIEEVIAPIPSAFVLLASGFLFLAGLKGFVLFQTLVFKIALAAAAGLTLGSLVIYGLSYFLGKPFIERWGKWLDVSWDAIQKTEERFAKGPGDELFLFFSRSIPIIPSVVITAFSGLIRIPLRTYILWSFLGTIVRASILAFLGYKVGGFYETYIATINRFENVIILISLLAAIVFLAVRQWGRRKRVRGTISP
ncbi:hypothetical protein EPN83_02915 [Patescibacteria group bacterium]|nr:MAG: hypothetical protein EPN83_02915 [Patescibacteria group bacterium]